MFKLNIECTKDFDELHIIFSDGTSTIVTNPKEDTNKIVKHKKQKIKSNESKPIKQKHNNNEALLNTDSDWGSISQDVVKKPVITERERPIKVAEELQNLDI